MKIVVYAICKNEEQFVERWMQSMSEADQVVVLDTGSTDNTVQRLRDRGAAVTRETVRTWRFDAARNRSLEPSNRRLEGNAALLERLAQRSAGEEDPPFTGI